VRPVGTSSSIGVSFDPNGNIQGGGGAGKTFRFREKGTYFILIAAAAYKVEMHQVRIRSVTKNQTIITGMTVEADATTKSQSLSIGFGIAQIRDDGEEFQIQHWTQAGSPGSLGNLLASSGEIQSFMNCFFMKMN